MSADDFVKLYDLGTGFSGHTAAVEFERRWRKENLKFGHFKQATIRIEVTLLEKAKERFTGYET